MSTRAEFDDEMLFTESMKSVRSDSTQDRYLIAGHSEGDHLRVHVIQTGQDVSELSQFVKDNEVMYILARYESTFDMSTTVKFVYFRWLGDKIPYPKRGKYGVVHGSVQERFNPYHLFIETSSVEDFNEDKILQQLEETTGKKSKVLESTAGRQERGFTASQLPKRGPLGKSGPQLATEGAKLEFSPEVLSAIYSVRSDEDTTNWMLAEYRDNSPKGPIDLTGTGEGDVEELKSYLDEGKPMYGLYRVKDTVDEISTVKFVYFQWVGNKVKPMTRAKISTHKGTTDEVFGPFHVSIFASDMSDISDNIVMEKVTSASGTKSHVK